MWRCEAAGSGAAIRSLHLGLVHFIAVNLGGPCSLSPGHTWTWCGHLVSLAFDAGGPATPETASYRIGPVSTAGYGSAPEVTRNTDKVWRSMPEYA
jgi:hypothetical protein